MRLSRPLIALCDAHGRSAEGIALLGGAAEAVSCASSVDAATLGALLVQQVRLGSRVGRLSEARASVLRGLELVGSRAASSWARRVGPNTMGHVAFQEDSHLEAEARFTEALRLATRQKASNEIAPFAGNIGVVRQVLGGRQGAAEQFRRELVIKRQLDYTRGVLSALTNLGNVPRLLGGNDLARTSLEEGLELALSTGNRSVLPNLRINPSVLAHGLGQHTLATEHFQAALRYANENGRRGLGANALFQLGRVSLGADEPLATKDWFMKALNVIGSAGSVSSILDSPIGLAWVRLQVEDDKYAKAWARAAAEHPASSAGTRSWAKDLLAELEQRRTRDGPAAGRPGRASPVNETVELAMHALVAAAV